MDLDLNLESMDPMMGLGPLLTQLETTSGCIEERMRQIEAVAYRARQRQRWRQHQCLQPQGNPQIVNTFMDPTTANVDSELRVLTGEFGSNSPQETIENGNFGKRDGTYLIAKALAMDKVGKKAESEVVGGFFDCNICLEMARDPILTCCGHLYCWPCFFLLPYSLSNVRECPACRGEVSHSSIIPIYGNGNGCKSKLKKESSINIPPRPRASRKESLRQQIVNRGLMLSSPFEVSIQRFSNLVGRTEQSHDTPSRQILPAISPATEAEENLQHRTFQVSRLLLQGAASFSSLSSALSSATNSAERLVEGLEAFVSSRHIIESSNVEMDSFASIAGDGAEMDFVMLPSTTMFRSNTPANVVTDAAIQVNSTLLSSSPSRRSTEAAGVLDVDQGVFHARRRRRLR